MKEHYFKLPMTMLWSRNPEGTVLVSFNNGWIVPWIVDRSISYFDYENSERYSINEQAYSYRRNNNRMKQ